MICATARWAVPHEYLKRATVWFPMNTCNYWSEPSLTEGPAQHMMMYIVYSMVLLGFRLLCGYITFISETMGIIYWYHDDVMKWKHFPRYWPFVQGIHRSPVNSPHKGQWRGALMFSFICVWINSWVNNREAGDWRRYRAHYDVIVMLYSWGASRHTVAAVPGKVN